MLLKFKATKRKNMNPINQSNELIEKSISFFKNLLNINFFNRSEQFFVNVASYATPIAALIGLLIGLTAAIKTDSFLAFLLGIAWVLVIAICYFIGSRFLNSDKILIENNPSKISSREYLDVTGLLSILIFIGILVGGLFLAIKLSRFDILKWSVLIAIPFLFYISLFLNPSQITTNITAKASAGEDALAIFILNSKAAVKLSGIIFGTLTTIGTLVLFFGWIDLLKGDGREIFVSSLELLGGIYIILGGLLYPYVIYLIFVFVYLFVDIARAILSIPNNKINGDNASQETLDNSKSLTPSYSSNSDEVARERIKLPDVKIDPIKAKKIGIIVAIVLAISALGYGGYLFKVDYDKKAAISKQQEELKLQVEQAKKELIAQAPLFVGKSSRELAHSPNAKLVFESILGDQYKTFDAAYGETAAIVNLNNQILGFGCQYGQCGKVESAFIIDTADGNIYVAIASLGLAKYYGLPEGKAIPEGFEKWKELRSITDSPK